MIKLLQHKTCRTALIAVAVSLFIILLYALGVFNFLEYKAYDSMMRNTTEKTMPSDDIMLVLLDQDSLDWAQEELGWSWPWPRKAYGDIVRFLADGGANSLVFDVMYTEPSLYGDDDDADFASASEKFAGTVQTVFFSEQYGNSEGWPDGLETPTFNLNGFAEDVIAKTCPPVPALFPISPLRSSASVMGNNSSTTDSDSIIRRTNIFYQCGDKSIPSLGLASLLARDGEAQTISYNKDARTVTLLGKDIPVDNEYKPYLRFRGDLTRYIPYNAAQILSSWYAICNGEEPLLEPSDFAGKYVFFGFYAPGLFDLCTTPISSVYPGVGVHITMLDNFLQGDFITKVSTKISFAIILLAAIFGAFTVSITSVIPVFKKHPIPYSAMAVFLETIILFGAVFVLFGKNLWLPSVTPIVALLISYIVVLISDYTLEGKQKKYLKSAFKQYLSPLVIEELIAHPDRLKLGGERKEISIFFSDVQGFTSISENLSPEDLTALLNDYLSAMSDIILDSGGTIDKYEGDAIIAFWNAPTEQVDHSKRALEAAMKCQEVLAQMRPDLAQRAKVPMYMRIGLNTGPAVVGNMGSHNRFDYTMLGDAVNLGARLEGQNKQFGTFVMCTKSMKDAAQKYGTEIAFRELARIAVVGKTEAVTVYQPLSLDEFTASREWISVFDDAREHFYAGDLQGAQKLFLSIADKDRASHFYAQKCAKLLASDLSTWQKGVWVADTK